MRHDPREGVLKFHHGRAQQPAESRTQLLLSTMGEMRRCSGKACPPVETRKLVTFSSKNFITRPEQARLGTGLDSSGKCNGLESTPPFCRTHLEGCAP